MGCHVFIDYVLQALPTAHGYTPVIVPQQPSHLSPAATVAALQQQSSAAYYQPQVGLTLAILIELVIN